MPEAVGYTVCANCVSPLSSEAARLLVTMPEGQEIFLRLAIAFAIGLLVGLERGWHGREAREGERVAGLRTFGLIGLLGGTVLLLGRELGQLLAAVGLLALAAIMLVAYRVKVKQGQDIGITSVIAGLLTFVLGGLAVAGYESVAAACAVVVTLLLNYKSQLHKMIDALRAEELRAGLQLLLISVVALPLLPNQGYGPWQSLNPYVIWWLVVLIAAISFIGYFAIRIGGVRRGILFTSLSGGLASSTAITLHLSRMARGNDSLAPLLAVGSLVACGTMFPRVLLIATLLNPALLRPLLPLLVVMTVAVYAPALLLWRSQRDKDVEVDATLKNPLELRAALSFGLLLALIMLLGHALKSWFGETGILALAMASGIADVDAITLSLARMSEAGLGTRIVVTGIVLAAAINSLAKAGIAAAIGGRSMGMRVGVPLVAAAVAGPLLAWLLSG
jgi:uncharacterized membrane protein (DUF4010 family)